MEAPSSFFFKKKHEEAKPCVKVKYTIKAHLEIAHEKDFKYKSVLMVREPPEVFDANINKQDRDAIKTWGCCDQGHSELKALFEKNIYMPTETARATVSVDNHDCKLDCSEVKMNVCLEIRMNIGHHHHVHEEDLKGAKDSHKGPHAGEKEWHKELAIDLSKIKYDAVVDKKSKDGSRVPLSIEDQFMMTQLQPACRMSKHFHARYFVEITTKFDGCVCCCNETPDAKVPMTIVPMVNPNCFGFAPPKGW